MCVYYIIFVPTIFTRARFGIAMAEDYVLAGPSKKSRRQQDKEKSKQLKGAFIYWILEIINIMNSAYIADLYFIVRWLDDEDVFDTLPAKDVSCGDKSVFDLNTGDCCEALYCGNSYSVEVIASGMPIINIMC